MNSESNFGVQLSTFIGVLIHRSWVIIAGAVLGTLLAYSLTSSRIDQFESSAILLVQESSPNSGLASDLNALAASRQLAGTYKQLINTRPVLSSAQNLLDSQNQGSLSDSSVTVKVVSGTQLLSITVRDPNPDQAAFSANAVAAAFINSTFERKLAAIGQLERIALAQGIFDVSPLTASRLASIDTLEIVELATPSSAPLPGRVRALIATGLMLGVFSGLLVAITLQFLSDPLPSARQLEASSGAPILGSIAEWKSEDIADDSLAFESSSSHVTEQYRTLASNLVFTVTPTGAKVIQFVSSSQGEGKTRTVANLTLALAERGYSVILVDADLRKPAASNFFYSKEEQQSTPGLSEILSTVSLDSKIGTERSEFFTRRANSLDLDQYTVHENIKVIHAGPTPPNPTSLLSTEWSGSLFERLKRDHDFVLVDGPPILGISDAGALSRFTDAAILVAVPGRTRFRQITSTLSAMDRAGLSILGLVMNRIKRKRLPFAYYYEDYDQSYYNSYYADEPAGGAESNSVGSRSSRAWGMLRKVISGQNKN